MSQSRARELAQGIEDRMRTIKHLCEADPDGDLIVTEFECAENELHELADELGLEQDEEHGS